MSAAAAAAAAAGRVALSGSGVSGVLLASNLNEEVHEAYTFSRELIRLAASLLVLGSNRMWLSMSLICLLKCLYIWMNVNLTN